MAYNKIVVPLDGSKLAEIALPHVEEIAAGCHVAEIHVVSVTESLKVQVGGEPVEMMAGGQYRTEGGAIGDSFTGRVYHMDSAPLQKVPLVVGKMAKAAKSYLVKIAQDMEKKGLHPKVTVLIGNVAGEIVHYAEEEGADLIVMASHGRSGVSHWAIGSVAEKVFRATDIPVLLVKPKAGTGFKETKPRRKGKPV
jgi:nucleotide-binding universal stress UspA family protein